MRTPLVTETRPVGEWIWVWGWVEVCVRAPAAWFGRFSERWLSTDNALGRPQSLSVDKQIGNSTNWLGFTKVSPQVRLLYEAETCGFFRFVCIWHDSFAHRNRFMLELCTPIDFVRFVYDIVIHGCHKCSVCFKYSTMYFNEEVMLYSL